MKPIKKEVKRALLGKQIKCRQCKGQAYIYLEDGRYRVKCVTCREDTLLKLYSKKGEMGVIKDEENKEIIFINPPDEKPESSSGLGIIKCDFCKKFFEEDEIRQLPGDPPNRVCVFCKTD